jgi:hypothetical protein
MHVSGALVMALEVRRPRDVPKWWCGRALNGKQDAKAQAHKRKRPRSAVSVAMAWRVRVAHATGTPLVNASRRWPPFSRRQVDQ